MIEMSKYKVAACSLSALRGYGLLGHGKGMEELLWGFVWWTSGLKLKNVVETD